MKTILRAFSFAFLFCCIPSVNRADPVLVWGRYAVTNIPSTATNVVALAGGDDHGVVLRGDGTVVAWGKNYYGQTNVPLDLTNVVSIAAGSTHGLALKQDGTVTLWGKIPFNAAQAATVPVHATNIIGLALGPGATHGLFLRADGTVLDWGGDWNGPTAPALTNIPPLARNVVQVAAGTDYALALRADGRVIGWGNYSAYYLTNIPAGATNIVAIASGCFSAAALRSDGTVLTWGTTYTPSSGLTNVVDVALPFNLYNFPYAPLLALRRDGTLVAYVGNGYPAPPPYPTSNIVAIASANYAGLALVGDGPPVFSGVPANRTVAVGSRAYFRALAVGAMPLSYQWTCNATNIPNATNTVLVLTNVQPAQAGSYYSLVASNSLGMATNGAMFLNALPVDFAVQNVSAFAGATAKFRMAYTNGIGPFAFQWQFSNTNLPGATTSSLSLTNVQLDQAGMYSLVVSNSYGSATNYATLTVTPMAFNTTSTSLAMRTNGLQLRLDSIYATNSVVIYASTDLVNWDPIFTNPPTTGSLLFLDTAATNTPQRFYRAFEQ